MLSKMPCRSEDTLHFPGHQGLWARPVLGTRDMGLNQVHTLPQGGGHGLAAPGVWGHGTQPTQEVAEGSVP